MTSATLEQMQATLGLTFAQLVRLVVRSPHTYKVYSIPKKTGGMRTIAQPAKETKLVQRWLIANVFDKLPVHDCATAYKSGASIRINAERHAANSYLSKLDFKNFFPSVKESDIVLHLDKHLSALLPKQDILWIAHVSCVKPSDGSGLCLSVGAPSSPLLSNSIMFDFDCELDKWCKDRGISYTRYADDLTFSSNAEGISKEIEAAIQDILDRAAYPRLSLNHKKTIHVSKKHQRRVTGIIINNEGALSLGRERKRIISALIHRFTLNQLDAPAILNLQGLLGFSKDVEPTFVVSMRAKYGSAVIDTILQIRKN